MKRTANVPQPIAALVDHLANLPQVVAVTDQGFRGPGPDLTDADWNLGLYYHGGFDPKSLSHLEGTVSAPGDWGRVRNGGAVLLVSGLTVKIHYRDVDEVVHWIQEAQQGRFEVDSGLGHLAGIPTYTLAAEVVLGRVLAGSLDDAIDYPDRLAEEGADRWRRHAESSLDHADLQATNGDVAGVMRHLARACVEVAHARLCAAREWTLNEKEILERAELTHMNQILTALNTDPVTLTQRVMQARTFLLD